MIKRQSFAVGTQQHGFKTSVTAFVEQTNLFSLSYKRAMKKSVKIVPMYLKNIQASDFFHDDFVDAVGIPKAEYLGFCDAVFQLYSRIENSSMRSKKLWILSRLNTIGVAIVLLSVMFLLTTISFLITSFNRVLSLVFAALFLLYITLVTALCVFYMTRVFRSHKVSAANIRKLNLCVFALNVRYKELGLEFNFQTSTRELVIRKLL